MADVLELDGWDVRFLGTNMPHDGVLKVVEALQADVLAVSVTMLSNARAASELISLARARPHVPYVLAGGAAFCLVPTLWQQVGADGFARDLREAAQVLRARGGAPTGAR